MIDDPFFRRNLRWVTIAHLLGLAVFVLVAKWKSQTTISTPVTWLDGGALGSATAASATVDVTSAASEEREVDNSEVEREIESASVPPPQPRAPSEIVLPKATPAPATPRPITPRPSTPRPATPKPATPKPATPKPATPRPTPNAATPAATPKPSPAATAKSTATPTAKLKSTSPAAVLSKTAEPAKLRIAAGVDTGIPPKNVGSGGSAGGGKGAGKTGGGSTTGNEFSWYYQMLQDRFESRWHQPTSVVRSAQDFVTTIKLRINKDGTVLGREIVNSSGNTVMDESVLAAAQKVQAVDPLPAGLGGETLEVNINFKLDQGQ